MKKALLHGAVQGTGLDGVEEGDGFEEMELDTVGVEVKVGDGQNR